jgi:hypothetical protein
LLQLWLLQHEYKLQKAPVNYESLSWYFVSSLRPLLARSGLWHFRIRHSVEILPDRLAEDTWDGRGIECMVTILAAKRAHFSAYKFTAISTKPGPTQSMLPAKKFSSARAFSRAVSL